jgi:hypothetical protein
VLLDVSVPPELLAVIVFNGEGVKTNDAAAVADEI